MNDNLSYELDTENTSLRNTIHDVRVKVNKLLLDMNADPSTSDSHISAVTEIMGMMDQIPA